MSIDQITDAPGAATDFPTVTFWSSVEFDAFMTGMLRALRVRGLRVRQRHAISAPAYRGARGRLARALIRFRGYVEYPLRLAWALAWASPREIHVVTTNPFFAPWVAVIAARRGVRVVHLVYDLFPEALAVADLLAEDAVLTRLMRRVVRATLERAAANVFLGERLLLEATAAHGAVPRASIIAVGADGAAFAASPPQRLEAGAVVDVLYCGNIGTMHDVTTVVHAIERLERRGGSAPFTLTFHASGPGYGVLRRDLARISVAPPAWVRCGNPLAESAWITRMARAHVALVTMKPGAERVVMPSKAYSALAAGQAILAVCPHDSDLAELVRQGECGWIVPPGDPDALVAALDEIVDGPDRLLARRSNAFRLGQGTYSADGVADEWMRLVAALA